MIEDVIERWHQWTRGDLPGGLDELLADDVVFYSPVVFTTQKGKEITKLYLTAAANTIGGSGSDTDDPPGAETSAFRYVTQILSGNTAMLEFETEMDGKYVNGIDLITANEAGKIIEFKVMVRPLQAVNAMHAQMKAMLEQLGG